MARRYDPAQLLDGDSLDAWQAWERIMKVEGKSPRTIENRAESVAQLAEYLAEHSGPPVIDATEAYIGDYLIHMGETRSKATQANRHRALRTFYNFLAAKGVIGVSPMAGLRMCDPEYKEQPVWSDEQLLALLAACRPAKGTRPQPAEHFANLRDEAIIRIWCEPGSPRLSEIAAMIVDDIDLGESCGRIRRGKGGKFRVFGLSAATAESVWLYKRARARHRHAARPEMWLGLAGPLTISGLDKLLDRRARMAGLPPVNPHSLRNTAYSDFDGAGGSLNDAMALFGWDHPDMALHYGKQARARRAVEASHRLARGDRLRA